MSLEALGRCRADSSDDLHAPLGPAREALFQPGPAQRLADLGGQFDGAADRFILLGPIDLAGGQRGLGDLPRTLEMHCLLVARMHGQVVSGEKVQSLAIVVGLGLLGRRQEFARLDQAVGGDQELGGLALGKRRLALAGA